MPKSPEILDQICVLFCAKTCRFWDVLGSPRLLPWVPIENPLNHPNSTKITPSKIYKMSPKIYNPAQNLQNFAPKMPKFRAKISKNSSQNRENFWPEIRKFRPRLGAPWVSIVTCPPSGARLPRYPEDTHGTKGATGHPRKQGGTGKPISQGSREGAWANLQKSTARPEATKIPWNNSFAKPANFAIYTLLRTAVLCNDEHHNAAK